MSGQLRNNKDHLVISYLSLRKTIGIIGVLMPVVLVAGSAMIGNCTHIQPSISDYYHTAMRDIFVGILCIVGLFLFSYKGYDFLDNTISNLSCLFAIGVALFPCMPESPLPQCAIHLNVSNPLINSIHFTSATLFFLSLAYMSLFRFTKKAPNPTPRKLVRNTVYRVCGFIILGCLVLLFIYFLLPDHLTDKLSDYRLIFWLESIALWAFGSSWLVKGEFLLSDIQRET